MRTEFSIVLYALLFCLASGVASGQLQETARLVPVDGAAGDRFGASVAISGQTVFVGAPGDDYQGDNAGAAHHFTADEDGWRFQRRYTKRHGPGPYTHFGGDIAVANDVLVVAQGIADGTATFYRRGSDDRWISVTGYWQAGKYFGGVSASDDTAVIGNVFGDGTGGGVFCCTVDGSGDYESHWIQANDSYFGSGVSVSGDTLLVGAPGAHGDLGAVVIFKRIDGIWTRQYPALQPRNAAHFEHFGREIAVDGNTAVIASSGGLHVFTRSNDEWIEDPALFPMSDYTFESTAFAIDNGMAIVGRRGRADAFVRYGTTWRFLAEVSPSDGIDGDQFGSSVAIDNGVVLVGAPGHDGTGEDSGAVYVFSVPNLEGDTDGDGLLDDWELNGIPYVDIDGHQQRFVLPSADYEHKDLYIEVDAKEGFGLSDGAVCKLVEAFADAPLMNPDGEEGVRLHILRDEDDLQIDDVWYYDTDSNGRQVLRDFHTKWRPDHYGTRLERIIDPFRDGLTTAKAKAYRYCIVGDRSDDSSTSATENTLGLGEQSGDNFFVFFGRGWDDDSQAGLFMHELGHCLGLDHGGNDGIIGKPNYPSIMNYVLVIPFDWSRPDEHQPGQWKLDYSRAGCEVFATLHEAALDESSGIGTSNSEYSAYRMPFGVSKFKNNQIVRGFDWVRLDGSPTDFGEPSGTGFQDGDPYGVVSQDLNYVWYGDGVPPGIPEGPSPNDSLVPYNDWELVRLSPAAAIGDGNYLAKLVTGELSSDAVDWLNTHLPPPPSSCPADLTRDGVVDTRDFIAFLRAWAAGESLADWDENGLIDTRDFVAYLNDWATGC